MRPNLRTEQEIMKNWKTLEPVVSIYSLSYNHVKFIEDTFEGLLIQETDFPFEIIIHDDASTDGTNKTIEEYRKKYPNIIKPIYQQENQYSKGISIAKNYICPKLQGKYTAFCECDDYWTDPLKLQKQVDFLEKSNDFVLTGHQSQMVDSEGKNLNKFEVNSNTDFKVSSFDMKTNAKYIPLRTWLVRTNCLKKVYNNMPKEYKESAGDSFLFALLGQYGNAYYQSNIKPAAYRIHSGGIWSSLNNELKQLASYKLRINVAIYHSKLSEEDVVNKQLEYLAISIANKISTKTLIKQLLIRIPGLYYFYILIKKRLNSFFNKKTYLI